MRKILLSCFCIFILSGCTINYIKEQDIKKYGLQYEMDKLQRLGINAVTHDKDGTVHLYVNEITPKTRNMIDKELIKIFGRKIDYVLHERKIDKIN